MEHSKTLRIDDVVVCGTRLVEKRCIAVLMTLMFCFRLNHPVPSNNLDSCKFIGMEREFCCLGILGGLELMVSNPPNQCFEARVLTSVT